VNRTYTWAINNPATGGVVGPRLNEQHVVTRVDAYVVGGTSVTFNIEERGTVGASGTDLLSSDLAAGTGGTNATTFGHGTLGSGSWLWLDVSAAAGTPSQFVATLVCTV